ncbi:MAG: ABC transporter ATP-binding protein [Bifidobacteriaceae bacterium]|jgi:iron complex transport system ATP-binding protein|nr:ABC transporter ATP-binding protein [Bifidobacteriaceae bacterium]
MSTGGRASGASSASSADGAGGPRLRTADLALGYRHVRVVDQVNLDLPDGSFTVIVGPNACGKSTLLRGLARLLAPQAGSVLLDGKEIARQPTKAVARRIGLLPQTAQAPAGLSVWDLVSRGRFPHRGLLRRDSAADRAAVARAMDRAGVADLAEHQVLELSGGQRQRVWLAMVLAQETDILLLDEPTTFLDIAHQVELLRLLEHLNAQGTTILAVLHDLNQAARHADHLIAMRDGRIVATGPPSQIVTAALVKDVFGLDCLVAADPVTARPWIIPK